MDIPSPDHDEFRVIIAGGGPVGLTLAHALAAAGIDHVVLERNPSLVSTEGTTLAIWPHNMRVYDQLKILGSLIKAKMDMNTKVNVAPGGKVVATTKLMDIVEKNHGHGWSLFFRSQLTDVLYKTLPKKSKTMTNKAVQDVAITSTGVVVKCTDGSIIAGSLLVGADGVNSSVRRIMEKIAVTDASRKVLNPYPCHKISFLCLVGHADHKGFEEQLQTGTAYEVRGREAQFQIVCTPDNALAGINARVTFLCYISLPEPRIGDDGRRFSEEETAAAAQSVAHLHVGPTLTFGQLWAKRKWALLTEGKEGMARDWHHAGRVVLLGDAAHKMSPQLGLGLNTGIQSAVCLANELRAMESARVGPYEHDDSAVEFGRGAPTAQELAVALARYQDKRRHPARLACAMSEATSAMLAWRTAGLRLLDRHILPALGGDARLVDWVLGPLVRRGLVLDALPENRRRDGRLPWKNLPTNL